MEKINVAELLKDCPKGMELNCLMYDGCTFDGIIESEDYPIKIQAPDGSFVFTKYGSMSEDERAKCVIFPKGKTTWEGFVPSCKFKEGDIVVNASNKDSNAFIYAGENDEYYESYVGLTTGTNPELLTDKYAWVSKTSGIRPATEEEQQTLFKAIKENGYRWNAETKTLEKLFKSKFKLGDNIRIKGTSAVYIVTEVRENLYILDIKDISLPFENQDQWELVPNKFDTSTLKPFNKVLVRDKTIEKWRINLFSHTQDDEFMFVCLEYTWGQCIPYEGNEHLLNTTDNCSDFYITWK